MATPCHMPMVSCPQVHEEWRADRQLLDYPRDYLYFSIFFSSSFLSFYFCPTFAFDFLGFVFPPWIEMAFFRGVWQGVAMDYPEFHPGSPCPTLLRPEGKPPLKRPFQGWPTHMAGGLQPSSTPLDTPRRTHMLRWRSLMASLTSRPNCELSMGVRRGISKGVEDGRMPPAHQGRRRVKESMPTPCHTPLELRDCGLNSGNFWGEIEVQNLE
jgi:hypothetical protein